MAPSRHSSLDAGSDREAPPKNSANCGRRQGEVADLDAIKKIGAVCAQGVDHLDRLAVTPAALAFFSLVRGSRLQGPSAFGDGAADLEPVGAQFVVLLDAALSAKVPSSRRSRSLAASARALFAASLMRRCSACHAASAWRSTIVDWTFQMLKGEEVKREASGMSKGVWREFQEVWGC